MAEASVATTKKNPKLPIAMVLILLLLGGGFFMLKSKEQPNGKPVIALAEKDTELDEFLTNTQQPSVYVRIKMTVRLRKDYDEAKFKDNLSDIRDSVLNVLNGLSPEAITDPRQRKTLKRTLAESINTALEGPVTGSTESKPQKHRTGKLEELGGDSGAGDAKPDNDWDSETGPVLKVRFLSLATQ
jgi:flagellar basal body-associated protein FliL